MYVGVQDPIRHLCCRSNTNKAMQTHCTCTIPLFTMWQLQKHIQHYVELISGVNVAVEGSIFTTFICLVQTNLDIHVEPTHPTQLVAFEILSFFLHSLHF